MFHFLNLRYIKMVNVTQITRKVVVQPSISHSNVLCIRRALAGIDESRRKGNDCLYHAPESGCGDKHTVIRRMASGQLRALAFHPVGHLSADFLSLLFKRFFSRIRRL